MKIIYKIFVPIILLSGFFSCKKEAAINVNENLIGIWKHNVDASNTIYLEIDDDSKGYIEYYENGTFKSDTQKRKWLIKDNKLFFGWLGAGDEKFIINQYPSISPNVIISGSDTISTGDTYIVLDEKYYVKIN